MDCSPRAGYPTAQPPSVARPHPRRLRRGGGELPPARRGADPEVDIGHEALIRGWRRLAGAACDFKAGWPREERNDGEVWRCYVGRAAAGQTLSFTGQHQVRRWIRERRLGPIWSQRYGDAWQAVDRLLRRSRQTGTVKVAGIAVGALIVVVIGLQLWSAIEQARAVRVVVLETIQGGLQAMLSKYVDHLDNIGFPKDTVTIQIVDGTEMNAWYDGKYMFINTKLVGDTDAPRREYTHHVLYNKIG